MSTFALYYVHVILSNQDYTEIKSVAKFLFLISRLHMKVFLSLAVT